MKKLSQDYKYPSLLVDIPDDLKKQLKEIQRSIPKKYIKEIPDEDFHITLLYSIKDKGFEKELSDIIKGFGSIKIETTGYGWFDHLRSEGEDEDQSVLYVKVKSIKLRNLHKEVKYRFDSLQRKGDYHPHITIAYMKPRNLMNRMRAYSGEDYLPEIECPKYNWEIEDLVISYEEDGKDLKVLLSTFHKTAHTSLLNAPAMHSKGGGLPPHRFSSDAIAKPDHLKNKLKEVSLGKDKDGYYIYTHRARSDSYKSPDDIPQSKIDFISSTGSKKISREKFNIVYHGTDKEGATDIKNNGINIDKSTGGYFGWGFYTTPDENLARSNYAEFTGEDEEDAVILKFSIASSANILDLRDENDWNVWGKYANQISDPSLYKRLVADGIDGLWDDSFDGVVIYNPSVLTLIDEDMKLKSAIYPGNMGIPELIHFYSDATDEQVNEMNIAVNNLDYGKIEDLIEDVEGVRLEHLNVPFEKPLRERFTDKRKASVSDLEYLKEQAKKYDTYEEFLDVVNKSYSDMVGDISRTINTSFDLAQEGEGAPLDSYDEESQKEWFGKYTEWEMPVPRENNITIYRATIGNSINIGDYVTQNKEYAEEHLDRVLDNEGQILSMKVNKSDLIPVNPNEFWYIPKNLSQYKSLEDFYNKARMSSKRKADVDILYTGDWVQLVKDKNYNYEYLDDKDGIAVLIQKSTDQDQYKYLGRFEKNPAHDEYAVELCSITGKIDEYEEPIDTSVREVMEEAGIEIKREELIGLGEIFPSKGTNQKLHLFGMFVPEDVEMTVPEGDGTKAEVESYVDWVTEQDIMDSEDGILNTLLLRWKDYHGKLEKESNKKLSTWIPDVDYIIETSAQDHVDNYDKLNVVKKNIPADLIPKVILDSDQWANYWKNATNEFFEEYTDLSEDQKKEIVHSAISGVNETSFDRGWELAKKLHDDYLLPVSNKYLQDVLRNYKESSMNKADKYKLKSDSIVKMEGIPVRTVDETIIETHPDNMNLIKEFAEESKDEYSIEKVSKKKLSKTLDNIPGGKGEKLDTEDVDPEEFAVGEIVEHEHSKNNEIAKEIDLDHLADNSTYYSDLFNCGLIDEKEALEKAKEFGWDIKSSKLIIRANKDFFNIYVDLDGTLANYDGKYKQGVVGEPIEEMINLLNEASFNGANIVVYTARSNEDYSAIEDFLKTAGLNYSDIILNKPQFDVMIDDKVLQFDGNARGLQYQLAQFMGGNGEWWKRLNGNLQRSANTAICHGVYPIGDIGGYETDKGEQGIGLSRDQKNKRVRVKEKDIDAEQFDSGAPINTYRQSGVAANSLRRWLK